MSLQDWVQYTSSTGDIVLRMVSNEETHRTALDLQGYEGDMYLLPRREHKVRGRLSGCFRTLYTKKEFTPFSEIRIYCMMSQEDIGHGEGACYAAGLSGDRHVSLYKYTEGLDGESQILCSLRLPAEYKQGVFGLMWAYDPHIRSGVFFRGLLSIDSKQPQNAFRLFDYLDANDPLIVSDGEGFGMSILQRGFTHALFERTALHAIAYTDPSESEED